MGLYFHKNIAAGSVLCAEYEYKKKVGITPSAILCFGE
jgi:hypothetical protein